jgi:coenzyme F420-reducing hydrogenase delta subunit
LKEIGLEPERLEMFHVGASDAPAWARAVSEMTQRAKKLGPNPLKNIIDEFRLTRQKVKPDKGVPEIKTSGTAS